jgi:hypothetical protein
MKLAARVLSLLILAGVAMFYVSCSKDDDPGKSETDTQIEKLNGTWKITGSEQVLLTGASPGVDYTGFTLTIAGTSGSNNNSVSFTATGRPELSPWPANGTLTFGTNVTETLVRSGDDVSIAYDVDDTTLQMEFFYDGAGYPGSRIKNVEGTWTFTFTKQ